MFSLSFLHVDVVVLACLATLALSFTLSLCKLAGGFIPWRKGS